MTFRSVLPVLALVLMFVPAVSFAASGPNLISNPSVESGTTGNPTSWSKSHKAANTTTFTYPVTGYNSTKALKVQVTRQAVSGDEGWYFAEVPVTPGKTYIFSDSYIGTVRSYLSVRYRMSNGTFVYSTTTSVAASSAWKTATFTIVPPANATAATVLHALKSNGALTTDNFSLTETLPTTPAPVLAPTCTLVANPTFVASGSSSVLSWTTKNATTVSINNGVGSVATSSGTTSVSPAATTTYTLTASSNATTTTATCAATVGVFTPVVVPPVITPTTTPTTTPPTTAPNLVTNGNLELGSTNAPTGWGANYWGTLTATFTYPVAGKNGGKAAKVAITKYTSGDAKWSFDHVPVSSHTLYTFTEDYHSTVKSNLTVEYKMQDGSYQYQWMGDAPVALNGSSISIPITVPKGAVSLSVFHSITAVGALTIDNASLVAQPANLFVNPMVSFVFDDGLSSQYQNALPILTAANMKASFGIITTEPASGNTSYMTWAQIKDLATKGHDIGNHTRTHAALTTLTATQLQDEVSGARSDLLAQGITPNSFVYPYGDTNATVEAAVKNAGHTVARGSYYGLNSPASSRYNLMDIRLDKTSDLATIKTYIDQAVEDKRWIVFELHDVVASGGDEYAITPAFLQSVTDYVASKGLSVVTLAQGSTQLSQ